MKSASYPLKSTEHSEKPSSSLKKYLDFPIQSGDAGSSLYCLNRKNSQILDFFRDELSLMRKLLNTCPVLKSLSEKRATAQLLAKQLCFLGMQKEKLSFLLKNDEEQLSDALRKGAISKLADLNRETEKLSRDIREFSMQFLLVKVAIYRLLKKFRPTSNRAS